mmetsp:Transcript_28950/g.32459  ORF Transcript_28950/g.32459 Transcript_28950/m.32459 type:complete len:226 (+) Transcript_28950:13-690(+)
MDNFTQSMNDVLSEAGLLVDNDKATEQMKHSISQLARLLVCPLCHKIFDRPTTLSSCAHSFCMDCIDEFASNAYDCPVKGCKMPMSIVGSHGGSYRNINPQLSQSIESLKMICNSLNKSKEHWWLSKDTLQSIEETKLSRMKEGQQNDRLDDGQEGYDNKHADNDADIYTARHHTGEEKEMNSDGDEDGEMIDLQQDNKEERLSLSAYDNDDNGDINELNSEDEN